MSCGDTSIELTWIHSGNPFGVTFCQLLPSSRVSCTRPSSVPAQITPLSWGDTASAKIVSYTSTPVTSLLTGPPERPCLLGSLRVRSGLIVSQVVPWSRLRSSTCAAW